jgi:hypothetical protein
MTPAQITEPRRGRPAAAAQEAETPLGRVLHWIEARLLDAAQALGMFDTCHERERLHDAERDRVLLDALRRGDAGESWIEVRAHLLEAVRIDALADAEDAAQVRHVQRVRHSHRRIGAWVERSCVAARGRAARRATVAVQGMLPEGVE